MKGFDPTIEDFGRTGIFSNLLNWQTCFPKGMSCPPGGQKYPTQRMKTLSEFNQSRFVGNRK